MVLLSHFSQLHLCSTYNTPLLTGLTIAAAHVVKHQRNRYSLHEPEVLVSFSPGCRFHDSLLCHSAFSRARKASSMSVAFPSAGAAVIAGGVLLLLYIFYRAALPKPLPGIPYNKHAAASILGDISEMMNYVRRTKRIFVSRVTESIEDGLIWK